MCCDRKECRDPGSNRGPLDLQSNALPTELSRLCWIFVSYVAGLFDRQRMSTSKQIWAMVVSWPCGPTDKASDYESGDCRFESCQGQLCFYTQHVCLYPGAFISSRTRAVSTLWVASLLRYTGLKIGNLVSRFHLDLHLWLRTPRLRKYVSCKLEDKLVRRRKNVRAPGWARTTNLSVNSRTR